ncbi:MAG: hypothetical protein GY702_21195, partial [Desulfobulbaceae bacterium]|nr:hypothetical protein [Desulfobulbaceae bacterium]
HFSVSVPQIYSELQSIPIRFLNYNQNSIEPEEGKYYYATHKGKSNFQVIFGSHINNTDYAGYIKNVNKNNKMSIRSEKIDDTVLLFLQNGYNSPYTVSIKIKLENLEASNKFPITKSISALSEIFISILRPLDPKDRYGYSINTSYRPD